MSNRRAGEEATLVKIPTELVHHVHQHGHSVEVEVILVAVVSSSLMIHGAEIYHQFSDKKMIRVKTPIHNFLPVPDNVPLMEGNHEWVFKAECGSNVEDWFQATEDCAHQDQFAGTRISRELSQMEAERSEALQRIKSSKFAEQFQTELNIAFLRWFWNPLKERSNFSQFKYLDAEDELF